MGEYTRPLFVNKTYEDALPVIELKQGNNRILIPVVRFNRVMKYFTGIDDKNVSSYSAEISMYDENGEITTL
jgi:hypothetical protein